MIQPDVHPPLTWGQLRAYAEDNEVPDDAVLELRDYAGRYAKVRDLSAGEDDGTPYLVVQEKWG